MNHRTKEMLKELAVAVVLATAILAVVPSARAQVNELIPLPEEIPVPAPGRAICNLGQDVCIFRFDELQRILSQQAIINAQAGYIAKLEREKVAPPVCADVTVTAPSKAPKLPLIPREPVDGGKS
jgi:hypothetical protein